MTVRHVDVPEKLRTYAEEKATKLLKFYDRIENLHVTVDIQKPLFLVEMEATVGHKVRLIAKVSHEDMFAAVDSAETKLQRQLRKFKEKLVDHRADKPEVTEGPSTDE